MTQAPLSRTALLLAFAAGMLVALALPWLPSVAAGGPADFTLAVERADRSVVHVTTVLEGTAVPGSRDDAVGSGFVLSADGLVVTSRHVLSGARRVLVTVPGRGTLEAQVVGQDPATDVAVLRVAAQGLAPLAVGDAGTLRVGQWVLAVGSPFHLDHSWSAGIVSGLGRSQVGVNVRGYEDFIQTDAAANLGNSGGPLVDADGRAVGMVSAILSRNGQNQGVTLAVPIGVVLRTARALAAGRPVTRPTLGVVVREIDVRGGGAPGLRITRFHPGSSGQAAGLLVGDVILSVGGRGVSRASELQELVWDAQPGTQVRLTVAREGRRFEVLVPVR